MIASILIIAFSLVLFVYWFRYTCLLILSAKTSKDYAGEVAATNQLSYPEVQVRLRGVLEADACDSLQSSLDRDFRLLTYLLRNAAEFQVGGYSLEERMLMIDYRIMKVRYSFARRFRPFHAPRALAEMTDIIGHFANAVGERAAARA